jgi:azurin
MTSTRRLVWSVLLLAACSAGQSEVPGAAEHDMNAMPMPAQQAPVPAAQQPLVAATAGTTPPSAAPSAAGQPGAAQAPAGAQAAAVGGKPVVEVHMTVHANGMTFDVTKITAAAGQTVHVVLDNKLPGVLAHNFALVKPGTEASVAAAGLKVGAAIGYLAEGPDLFAHTDMVQPGKSGEVSFAAPTTPGKYPYICTFPGHYMMMKGVLEVTP